MKVPSHSQEQEHGLAMARLWGTVTSARRGPKPKLTLEAIVEAALGIARGEGLEAVSMMRVAEASGCAKMALYRHVSNRNDLLAAMLDAALGDPPTLVGKWRERFTILWDALLALYARDSWLLDLSADADMLTPRNVAWIDTGLSLFEATDLSPKTKLGIVLLITENARFVARHRKARGRPVDDLDRLLSSATSARAWLPAERYPHLAALDNSDHDAQPLILSGAYVRDMMIRAIADCFPSEPK